ncbi:MAG: dihydroorotate dehydrogenase-like protein [Ilumatobacteraceae bacterium]
MTDLSTTYLGMHLRSPLIASAGPLTGNPAMWGRLEEAGAGAIVLPSLFEEQIEHDIFAAASAFDRSTDVSAEALTFFPDLDSIAAGPHRHLDLVEDAVERVDIPVIASINGTTPGGWVRYARSLESAGAAAIELNVYEMVTNPGLSAADVERRLIELVEEVRAEITVPLAVKLGPWFTSLGHLVVGLCAAGADGVVLFNRFYQPDIDVETLQMTPRLHLSSPGEVRLPLHWIGALRSTVDCSLAASTGVHTGDDLLKLLLVGADAVMATSSLLLRGPEHLAVMRDGLREWMLMHEYESVRQLQGAMSRANVPDPQAYDRLNYYQVLQSWTSPVRG